MSLWLKAMKEIDLPLLAKLPITVCIVGSRKLCKSEEDLTYPWNLLAPNLKVYGLDADPNACELANAYLELVQINWFEKHFPVAVSSFNGRRTFYQTRNPNCGSILLPNPQFVNRISQMNEGFQIIDTFEVDVITLDQFCSQESIEQIDFLQTDVQGADLDVLKGAVDQLTNSIIGLMVEVLFTPLYQDQPVFSDIDQYLQHYGFQLFDLEMEDTWCRLHRHCSPIIPSRRGQLLWADAYYFKDPLFSTGSAPTNHLKPDQIFKLACLSDILRFSDFSLELLKYLTISYGEENADYNFSRLIINIMTKLFPDRVNKLPIVCEMKNYLQ